MNICENSEKIDSGRKFVQKVRPSKRLHQKNVLQWMVSYFFQGTQMQEVRQEGQAKSYHPPESYA